MKISKRMIISAASIACFTACIGDFWLTFVVADYVPGYSHLRQTMSMLGLTNDPPSVIISAWWIILGFLIIVFALGFAKAFGYQRGTVKVATWLLIIYGLGEGLGSALFKAEHLHHVLTPVGQIHEVMGAAGVITILILPFVMMKIIHRSDNPGFYLFSWIVFVSELALLTMFIFRFTSNQVEGIYLYQGLWQRLFILDYYIYLITIGVIMIKRQQSVSNIS